MADSQSSKIAAYKDDSKEPRNLFSLFPKFEFKVPFLNHEKKGESKVKVEQATTVVAEGEREVEKPRIVRFPQSRQIVPPTLEAEAEVSSGKTSNPLIIWQVYALGGFIVLNWIWARWKERQDRAKKESPDANESTDEYQSPADGEED